MGTPSKKIFQRGSNYNRMKVRPIEVSVNTPFVDPFSQGLQQMTGSNVQHCPWRRRWDWFFARALQQAYVMMNVPTSEIWILIGNSS